MKQNIIKRFFKTLGERIDILYGYYLSFLFLLIIILIFIFSYLKILTSNVFSLSDMLVMTTAAIAINIALCSMVFSYVGNLNGDDKNRVIKIGEELILSSIGFILNLVFTGIIQLGYIDELFAKMFFKEYVILFFFLFVLIILLISVAFFVHSIYRLICFILVRAKHNI